MRLTTTIGTALLCGTLSTQSLAEEEHRELGAHEHGHGTLNIAIEGNTVAMELEVPGADIIGFEHEAKTQAQKATLEDGRKKLAAVLTLFKFPSGAGCVVDNTDVDLKSEHNHAKEEKSHDHDHDHSDHGHHHDEADAGKTAHTEFHATYELTCEDTSKITNIYFNYFDTFANAQELDVNVVTTKGQSTFEATRDKPQIELGGLT